MPVGKKKRYYNRFQKHLNDIFVHLEEGDYVQASEKVWGAISSLVNATFSLERKGIKDKKEGFVTLYRSLSVKHPHLRDILKQNCFKNANDLITKASGLHEYFYGGRDYPEKYLKNVIEGCAKVLEEIDNVSK